MGKNSTDFLSHPGQGYVKKRGVCPAFLWGADIVRVYARYFFIFWIVGFYTDHPGGNNHPRKLHFRGGIVPPPLRRGELYSAAKYISDVRAIIIEIWLLKQKIPHMVGFSDKR